MWGDQLRGSLKCLVSIGTGVPTLKPVRDDILGIWAPLKELATETEKTAEQFRRDKSNLDDEGRYYRFNVDHGLEDIGLKESKKKKEIAAATGRYVASQAVFKQMNACVNNLAGGEFTKDPLYSHPLVQSRREIRLLKVCLGDETDDIAVSIKTVSLDDELDFDTLSYC